MRRGAALLLALCALAGGCDQDPLGLDRRSIHGGYELEQVEGGVYYVQRRGEENPVGVGGGAVDRIGWNRRWIVAHHVPPRPGVDEWVVVDMRTGDVSRPRPTVPVTGEPRLRATAIRPAAEAWRRLPPTPFTIAAISALVLAGAAILGLIARSRTRSPDP